MQILGEEMLGPLRAVLGFDTEADAIRLANRSMYGLAAGIWTKDVQKAHRVARTIKAGTVWVNTYNFYDPAAPFGGFKISRLRRHSGGHAPGDHTPTKTLWVRPCTTPGVVARRRTPLG